MWGAKDQTRVSWVPVKCPSCCTPAAAPSPPPANAKAPLERASQQEEKAKLSKTLSMKTGSLEQGFILFGDDAFLQLGRDVGQLGRGKGRAGAQLSKHPHLKGAVSSIPSPSSSFKFSLKFSRVHHLLKLQWTLNHMHDRSRHAGATGGQEVSPMAHQEETAQSGKASGRQLLSLASGPSF